MVDRVPGTDTAFHQKNGSDALKQDCSIVSLQRNTYHDPTQKRHDLRITRLPFHARTTTSAARAPRSALTLSNKIARSSAFKGTHIMTQLKKGTIYELRVYHSMPERLPALLARPDLL